METLPPNMNAEQYALFKEYRSRISTLTNEELTALKMLNALSISHLSFTKL